MTVIPTNVGIHCAPFKFGRSRDACVCGHDGANAAPHSFRQIAMRLVSLSPAR